MPKPLVFVAYPARPEQVATAMESACEQANRASGQLTFETWKQQDIPGRFIVEGILEKIDASEYVVADITRLNFNVTFEVGYAIGAGKRVVLTVNVASTPETKEITNLGVFDTLGWATYSN